MSLILILLVVALLLFVLAAANVSSPVNFTALGLAVLTVAIIVGRGS